MIETKQKQIVAEVKKVKKGKDGTISNGQCTARV
jgi:hypothetical protein